jgi:hypothetical protein
MNGISLIAVGDWIKRIIYRMYFESLAPFRIVGGTRTTRARCPLVFALECNALAMTLRASAELRCVVSRFCPLSINSYDVLPAVCDGCGSRRETIRIFLSEHESSGQFVGF